MRGASMERHTQAEKCISLLYICEYEYNDILNETYRGYYETNKLHEPQLLATRRK